MTLVRVIRKNKLGISQTVKEQKMNKGSLHEKPSVVTLRQSHTPQERQGVCCSPFFAGGLCLSPLGFLAHPYLELSLLLATVSHCWAQSASITRPSAKGGSCSEGFAVLNRQRLRGERGAGMRCGVSQQVSDRAGRMLWVSSPLLRCLHRATGSLIKPIWKIKLLNINVICL